MLRLPGVQQEASLLAPVFLAIPGRTDCSVERLQGFLPVAEASAGAG